MTRGLSAGRILSQERLQTGVAVAMFLLGFLLQHIGLVLPARLVNAPFDVWHLVDGTHEWLDVSYATHGFIRRGLVGTVLSPFPPIQRLLIYAILVLVSLAYVLKRLLSLCAGARRGSGAVWILACVLVSPLGLMQLGWTFGRFEQLNLGLLFLAMHFASERSRVSVAVSATCMLLVHEASVFYAWPIIAACSLRAGRLAQVPPPATVARLIGTFVVPGALAVWLMLYGNATTPVAMGALRRNVFQPMPFDAYAYGLCGSYLLSIAIAQHTIYQANDKRPDLLFFVPFANLALFLLGVDYARWTALTFLVSATCLLLRYEWRELDTFPRWGWAYAPVAVVLTFPLLGPFGVVSPFPAATNFLQLLGRIS